MQSSYDVLGVGKEATQEDIHRAYRELARKWHPDLFPEGTERIQAERKMVEINAAYNACVSRHAPEVIQLDSDLYSDVRLLIEAGQLSRARKILNGMGNHDAEWNYYLGLLLLLRQEYDKAALFLRIAHRMDADNTTYEHMLNKAEMLRRQHSGNIVTRFLGLFRHKKI